jgi:uncharacterized protein YuzE
MTTTQGTVTEITIRQDGLLGTLKIVDTSGVNEGFFLWLDEAGAVMPFSVWVGRSLTVSLLRDAMTYKRTVALTHDDSSALVLIVSVSA